MNRPKLTWTFDGYLQLWILTSFDYTSKQFFLHAICTSEAEASLRKKAVEDEYRIKERRGAVRIESCVADHLLGVSMMGVTGIPI